MANVSTLILDLTYFLGFGEADLWHPFWQPFTTLDSSSGRNKWWYIEAVWSQCGYCSYLTTWQWRIELQNLNHSYQKKEGYKHRNATCRLNLVLQLPPSWFYRNYYIRTLLCKKERSDFSTSGFVWRPTEIRIKVGSQTSGASQKSLVVLLAAPLSSAKRMGLCLWPCRRVRLQWLRS